MNRSSAFKNLFLLVPGMAVIVISAASIGLAFNHLSPNGLPLIRKPLRETRRFATNPELMSSATKSVEPVAPNSNPVPASVVETSSSSETENGKKQEPKVEQEPAKPISTAKIIAPAPKQPKATTSKPKVDQTTPQPKKAPQALFTTLDDAKSLFDKDAAVFLDARAAIDYEAEHIKGALSLFSEDVDDLYKKVLFNVPVNKVIVTYCSDPECSEAVQLADALVAKGYLKVVILLEGLPGWKEAGYPTAKGQK